jgi:hypothetical protein
MGLKMLKLVLLGFYVFAFPALVNAQSNSYNSNYTQDDVDQFSHDLIQVNRYSPLESAGSHGSIGVGLGFGAQSTAWTSEKSFLYNHVLNSSGNSRDEVQSRLNMPKVYFVKGTSWPLDFGAGFGKSIETGLTQFSAHVQWTAFEEFRMPSLALRGTYSRLTGINNVVLNATGVDALASYGFSYFTAYVGYGVHYNKLNFKIVPNEEDFSLYEDAKNESWNMSTINNSQLYGLKIVFLPPFVYAAAEIQTGDRGQSSFAAKLSVGI